ncbi:M50 family metallopeptidase [Paenibacillus dokdonensis]|uniref:M50 family metallopeptidase n=1 Tax=Paenibacillus dokdonensis TaxID=2567944 RepID=A0ABU6GM14_9BACL|nr:M50 family metallopeptidase [Paenibacillus dokdonensis]MEC0240796.1 M50 family metallopeptidase [Paenibacillus dokdonensis]
MILVVVLTSILTRFLPFSAFFRNVDTLVHELSHALITLVLSGKVMVIYLYGNQSGVTLSSFAENWMSIPISLAGYIGSALFALLLFFLYAKRKERAGLIVVTVLAAIAAALFVRNGYGIFWCAGFAFLTALVAYMAPPWLRNGYYMLIAFICLVESVVSPFVILSLSLYNPGAAGDAANLAQVTHIPALVWCLVFTAISLWIAKLSTSLLFKRGFSGKPQASGR